MPGIAYHIVVEDHLCGRSQFAIKSFPLKQVIFGSGQNMQEFALVNNIFIKKKAGEKL